MYKLLTDSPAKKTNILKINLSGRFTLNIIDELVIVHHRNSFSSLIFDIRVPGEFDGYTTCNFPLIKKASIQSIKSIQSTEIPLAHGFVLCIKKITI
jgi:regulator of MON1-CCZ1 complex